MKLYSAEYTRELFEKQVMIGDEVLLGHDTAIPSKQWMAHEFIGYARCYHQEGCRGCKGKFSLRRNGVATSHCATIYPKGDDFQMRAPQVKLRWNRDHLPKELFEI
jgi:hypothetical protein